MLEALKNRTIIDKVGGRFRLTALMQKRMQEILTGSRPLIDDIEGMTLMEIVAEEILQDKITFDNLHIGKRLKDFDAS